MGVTRDDVARLAGVSPATVSYVVNNGPRPVSPATRQRVLRAIAQLNYHPSGVARSLKTQKTHTVGIVVSDILNHVLAAIAKRAEDLLFPNNYSVTLCNSDESPERERVWLGILRGKRADGILLLPTGSSNLRLIYSVLELGTQIVLIDRQINGLDVDCVLFDNEAGAYAGVRHLIELGHARIGLVNLPSHLTPGRGRLAGYIRAFRDAGLMVDHQLVREGSFKAEDGHSLTGELLDLNPPPTALLAASNRLSRGVFQQVRERGLRMPDGLAVCVFDDLPMFSYLTPSITAVRYDVEAFTKKAVRFLCERIDGKYVGGARTVLIPCELQARESTLGTRIASVGR